MNQLVYALILAGGMSSRMGQDKALVPFGGVPLLKRVGLVAEVCTDRVYVLTPWQERYASIASKNWQFIPETEPGQGALVALKQGLSYLDQDNRAPEWVLLLACDLPCLDGLIINKWRSHLSCLERSSLAFVPKNEKGWEPLCAFYRMGCLASLEECKTRSFQEWLNTISVVEIPGTIETQGMLKNCNTPQDLVI